MELKRLTTDEIRSLKTEIKILTYNLDQFLETEEKADNINYQSSLKSFLSKSIHNTIDDLYSIVKDTGQGYDPYGTV